jgi:thymidine kinase
MLHIITGCMYAGKTTSLENTFNILKQTQRVMVLDFDTTKSNTIFQSTLYTHDNFEIPCIKLTQLNIDYMYYDSILINEAQFFTGLVDFVKKALLDKKIIYVYGLDGDFKQEKFGEILDLIPLCDTYVKLYAKCACGNKACFSKRISTNQAQFLPNDKYIPVCRHCLY